MRNLKSAIGAVLFLLLFVPLFCAFDGQVDIDIRVYKIPRLQKWDAQISGENGSAPNVRVDGDLTAVFPDGIVFLQTELSPLASDSAVFQAIRDRIYFGGYNFQAASIKIEDLKRAHFKFDNLKLSEEVRFEKEISSYSKEDYRLSAGLKSVNDDEIVMNIKFDSGRSSFGGGMGAGIIGTIFDQSMVLPEQKILLIGFPSHDSGPRGTVFWLAVSASKNGL